MERGKGGEGPLAAGGGKMGCGGGGAKLPLPPPLLLDLLLPCVTPTATAVAADAISTTVATASATLVFVLSPAAVPPAALPLPLVPAAPLATPASSSKEDFRGPYLPLLLLRELPVLPPCLPLLLPGCTCAEGACWRHPNGSGGS